MKRRDFVKNLATSAALVGISPLNQSWAGIPYSNDFTKEDFGSDFKWGVATAAYQIEGAWNLDGKGPSIWDHFTHSKKKKIKDRLNADVSCDFYHKYEEDLALLKEMNMKVFRFSISWPRIFPKGTGEINQKGLDFYHNVIDRCLELDLEPWITIYHWDLPQALEEQGGWANREVIKWFSDYAEVITKEYGPKVKNWMVLNEPVAYTVLGYLAGIHAPGHSNTPKKFLKAVHHTAMVQAEGGRIIRRNVLNAYVGTTLSCSHVEPKNQLKKHQRAAHRMDAILNRLYAEPLLGMGYPTDNFPFLKGIEQYIQEGDMEKLKFDFDFIGLQNYTKAVIRHFMIPYLWAFEYAPAKRGVPKENRTEMGWEIYPEGIYKVIKRFSEYKNFPPIIITENGAAFNDIVEGPHVHDKKRVAFFKAYLENVLKAIKEGVDVRGYLVWTLMDNFEWAEGYHARFGLIHIDYETQERRIKDSGLWFKELLK